MNTRKSGRYRVVEARGSYHEMGCQIGEEARDEIQGFCDIALQRINKTVTVNSEQAIRIARDSLRAVEKYAEHLVEEMQGMSEASGVPLDDLMLLQIRNQFVEGMDFGCTSVSLKTDETVYPNGLLAQNWDNDPAFDPFTLVIIRRPVNAPDMIHVSQAGLIAYLGVNDTGLGVCLNALAAPTSQRGVPLYFILRRVYESRSLEEALRVVRDSPHAIPVHMMMMSPEGPTSIEITVDNIQVLQSSLLTHTNHCIHPDLMHINQDFPEMIDSGSRLHRIQSLTTDMPECSMETIQHWLRDHDNYPRSICRHANDDLTHGFFETVFSLIIDVASQTIHLSRGTPCNNPYESYMLNPTS